MVPRKGKKASSFYGETLRALIYLLDMRGYRIAFAYITVQGQRGKVVQIGKRKRPADMDVWLYRHVT